MASALCQIGPDWNPAPPPFVESPWNKAQGSEFDLVILILPNANPGQASRRPEDTFQTLATRNSFDPTDARLRSTRLLVG